MRLLVDKTRTGLAGVSQVKDMENNVSTTLYQMDVPSVGYSNL